jgi:S1-C subfamily serine protease
MLKSIFKIITIFIIGMVGGIFADQIFWPYFIERPLFYQYRLEQKPVYLTERKEIYIQENKALKEAIEKVEKVVIGVKTETRLPSGSKKILEGSGLILTADGLVITLAELVPQGSVFNFFVEGTPHQINGGGQILKRDLKKNLALIKLEKTNLPTVGFANLEKLKLGERVFLVGLTSASTEEGIKKVVNEGIVTNFDQNLIETNIFEKSSLAGSPLFDIEGRVLGLNTINKEGKVISLSISQIRIFANL